MCKVVIEYRIPSFSFNINTIEFVFASDVLPFLQFLSKCQAICDFDVMSLGFSSRFSPGIAHFFSEKFRCFI